MKVERIHLAQAFPYRQEGGEKIARDEKKTLLSDAVTLDTERRKQGQEKDEDHPNYQNTEPEKPLVPHSHVTKERDHGALDLIA